MPSLEERRATWAQAGYHLHSHPRSGTHYLMALLDENFIQHPGERFRDAFGHDRHVNRHLHGLPDQCDPTWFDSGHHFYIWRGWEGVANSILSMPERFGITEELTLEEFSQAKWSDIYTPKVRWAWRQWGKVERGDGTAFGATFHKEAINYNTKEFWEHHKKTWQEFAKTRDNVYIVKYESLLNDFQITMSNIALWLGKPVGDLKQIEEKVSGQPI
jgi:hypothetical protein